MSLKPLVTVTDVTDRLPSTVMVEEKRVAALIADASAAARRISKQEFTIRQSTVGIRPIGYKLRLPQSPVISVDEISIRLPNSLTTVTIPGWYWDGSDEVWLTDGGSIINLAEELLFVLQWQTPTCLTTYTHGYTEVPDDVVGVVCSMVNRIITAPGLGGVISESVGEYSYRLSDAAAQGTMGLTEAETKILRSYIPRKTSTAELRG
jgi:hypothetical protein